MVKLVKTNEKNLLTFKDDIAPVFDAQRISLDNTCDELLKFSKELEKIKEIVELDVAEYSKKSLPHRTQAISIFDPGHAKKKRPGLKLAKMEKFILYAVKEMDNALCASQNTKDNFKSLLIYFGEDKSMKSEDFFGTIQSFATVFDTAYEQVLAQEKALVSIFYYSKFFLA